MTPHRRRGHHVLNYQRRPAGWQRAHEDMLGRVSCTLASGGEGVRRAAGVVGIPFTVHPEKVSHFFVIALEMISGSDFSCDDV
jgi:hypothetical protein